MTEDLAALVTRLTEKSAEQREEIASLRARLEASEAECMEQARLNGMGAEREFALKSKLVAAEKDRDQAKMDARATANSYYEFDCGHTISRPDYPDEFSKCPVCAEIIAAYREKDEVSRGRWLEILQTRKLHEASRAEVKMLEERERLIEARAEAAESKLAAVEKERDGLRRIIAQDSAELRALCEARDQARKEVDMEREHLKIEEARLADAIDAAKGFKCWLDVEIAKGDAPMVIINSRKSVAALEAMEKSKWLKRLREDMVPWDRVNRTDNALADAREAIKRKDIALHFVRKLVCQSEADCCCEDKPCPRMVIDDALAYPSPAPPATEQECAGMKNGLRCSACVAEGRVNCKPAADGGLKP